MRAKSTLVFQSIETKRRSGKCTAKFIMAGFYKMDFKKSIVRLVKVDDIYKVSKSAVANCFWLRDGIG